MPPEPELVADTRCQTGEGPVWHPDEGCLYWADIPAGRIHRFEPSTGDYELVYEGKPVGGITVQADGALLLLGERGFVAVWRDGRIERMILDEIANERDSRFNDVIADPDGRVFCGAMPVRDAQGQVIRGGRLYRLDPDNSLTMLLDGLGVPNGMGFTPDLGHLYVTDTIPGTQTIYRFDYDRATGALNNRQVFLQTPLDNSEGRPDGMTVDVVGNVWSARWDGGQVVCLAPDGTAVSRIQIPARKVTSLAFGGMDYSDLYVTTAGGHNREQEGAGAGALFRLRTGVRGVPEFRSRVGL